MAKRNLIRHPEELAKVPVCQPEHRRVLGVDLGTNCGVAILDLYPEAPRFNTMFLGQWDLSLGDWDSGPLRHLRLQQFLSQVHPDLIAFEEVKYTPPMSQLKTMSIQAVLSRTSTSAEFLGGLKVTLTTWAELRNIPAQGIGIGQIKKFATGRGNANKSDMIQACNSQFETDFPYLEGTYENEGVDNIADAAWVAAYAASAYYPGIFQATGRETGS